MAKYKAIIALSHDKNLTNSREIPVYVVWFFLHWVDVDIDAPWCKYDFESKESKI